MTFDLRFKWSKKLDQNNYFLDHFALDPEDCPPHRARNHHHITYTVYLAHRTTVVLAFY